MTPETLAILRELDEFVATLSLPLSEDLRQQGWDELSANGMRGALEDFRRKIEERGALPPMEERPWDMIRGLDSWGIDRGALWDKLCEFGDELWRAP